MTSQAFYASPTADWLTVSCSKSDLVPLLDAVRPVLSCIPGIAASEGGGGSLSPVVAFMFLLVVL